MGGNKDTEVISNTGESSNCNFTDAESRLGEVLPLTGPLADSGPQKGPEGPGDSEGPRELPESDHGNANRPPEH